MSKELNPQGALISGLHFAGGLLWMALPEERRVGTYDPSNGKAEERLAYGRELWDACPGEEGLWLLSGGGRLGRELVLWSLGEKKALRSFPSPDGAGAGLAVFEGKLWVSHRRKRKLFCLDADSGKVKWIVRTENETFGLSAFRNELWLVECDPGPLGPWSEKAGRYFFSRYDPARERIVERLPVAWAPACMAFDGEKFWYSETGKRGLASTKKDPGKL